MAEAFGIIAGGVNVLEACIEGVSSLNNFIQNSRHSHALWASLRNKVATLDSVMKSLRRMLAPQGPSHGNISHATEASYQYNISRLVLDCEESLQHLAKILDRIKVDGNGLLARSRQLLRFEQQSREIIILEKKIDGYISAIQLTCQMLTLFHNLDTKPPEDVSWCLDEFSIAIERGKHAIKIQKSASHLIQANNSPSILVEEAVIAPVADQHLVNCVTSAEKVRNVSRSIIDQSLIDYVEQKNIDEEELRVLVSELTYAARKHLSEKKFVEAEIAQTKAIKLRKGRNLIDNEPLKGEIDLQMTLVDIFKAQNKLVEARSILEVLAAEGDEPSELGWRITTDLVQVCLGLEEFEDAARYCFQLRTSIKNSPDKRSSLFKQVTELSITANTSLGENDIVAMLKKLYDDEDDKTYSSDEARERLALNFLRERGFSMTKDLNHRKAVECAASQGQLDALDLVLGDAEHKEDEHLKEIAIRVAFDHNQLQIAEALIPRLSTPTLKNKALILAVCKGDKNLVAKTLAQGANVQAVDNPEKNTVLHVGAMRADDVGAAIVELLLSYRADVQATNMKEQTPLHLANDFRNNEKISNLLISNGADVNAKDCGQRTPLHFAVKSRDLGMVDALISHNADPKVKHTKTGKTLIHWAKHELPSGTSTEIIRTLEGKRLVNQNRMQRETSASTSPPSSSRSITRAFSR